MKLNRTKSNLRRTNSAFTLVEMLLVLVILMQAQDRKSVV